MSSRSMERPPATSASRLDDASAITPYSVVGSTDREAHMRKTGTFEVTVIILSLVVLSAAQAIAGTLVDLADTPVPTLLGTSPGDRFGYAVATGDLDGDGRTELVIAAPGHDPVGGPVDAGAVYVFDAGVVASLDEPVAADSIALLTIVGGHAQQRLGESLLVADLNGDSVDDLVVASPAGGSGTSMQAGRVYLFHGPLSPGGTTRVDDLADDTVRGTRPGDRFGSSLAAADIVGDGVHELLVSAFRAADASGVRAGSVYIIRMKSLAGGGTDRTASETALAEIRGEGEGDALRGIAVLRGAGGAPPMLALGAYHADGPGGSLTDCGKIYMVRGDEIASLPLHSAFEIDAPVILGPHPRSFLGRSLATGDMDGDGLDDLAVSAYASRLRMRKADASGEVFLVFGSDGGPPHTLDPSDDAVPRFSSESRWDLFGLPILMRDVSGDGTADLIVSSQFADSDDGKRQRCGKIHVYRGGLRSVINAKTGKAKNADAAIVGGGAFDSIGGSLAVVTPSDGGIGLVVGAPDAPDANGGAAAGKTHLIPARLLQDR
jgi:hypothetical protein